MHVVTVARLSLALSLTLSAAVPAGAADVPGPDLRGHWRCTGTGIPATERSFFSIGPWEGRTKQEIFSAADTTTKDGLPATSFERIVETPDGTIRIQAVEGNGTLSAPTASVWPPGRGRLLLHRRVELALIAGPDQTTVGNFTVEASSRICAMSSSTESKRRWARTKRKLRSESSSP